MLDRHGIGTNSKRIVKTDRSAADGKAPLFLADLPLPVLQHESFQVVIKLRHESTDPPSIIPIDLVLECSNVVSAWRNMVA